MIVLSTLHGSQASSRRRLASRWSRTFLLALLIGSFLPVAANAQYFGRNKVQYDDFDFESFKTEHFEFYLYPEERLAVQDAA
ncbi:MAG: hypothetical protein ACPG8N_08895, partial [Rhodothermales bacterium]